MLPVQQFYKPLVKAILVNAIHYEWSVQGFGMFRLYLKDGTFGRQSVRLHLWDSRWRVPNVTLLHTHPWSLHSHVVAGTIANHLYRKLDRLATVSATSDLIDGVYREIPLQAGYGGGLLGEGTAVILVRPEIVTYQEGQSYHQEPGDIHSSHPYDGTVTLCIREVPQGWNPDHAFVYRREQEPWVSAEPRRAARDEIQAAAKYALQQWF